MLNYNYLDISDEQIDEIITSQNYSLDIKNDEFYTNLKQNSPCNSFITSLFDKERFLFILKYGIMYLTKDGALQKHIMRYPQFFATRNIIKKLQNNEKRGVIWHTQGSGKTALAAFANRIIYDFYSKQDTTARFFFITDRLDLATQAKDEFEQRNFKVTTSRNKDEFTIELSKEPEKLNDNIGEFCVAILREKC